LRFQAAGLIVGKPWRRGHVGVEFTYRGVIMTLRADRSHIRAAFASAALFALTLLPSARVGAQEPIPARPATHTVKRGDTLWDLSKLYLGDPFLWPEIYRLNTDQIEDPHWIYPGEVLKLPGETRTIAAKPAEPEPAVVTPTTPTTPTAPTVPTTSTVPAGLTEPAVDSATLPAPLVTPAPTLRMGEYLAAPWVDIPDGPKGSGRLIEARDLPGIASADRSRLQLYDHVYVSPPVGSVAAEHELYLTYNLGPLIEEFGQVVIPTGIVEVTRSARNGEAATARVVKLYNEMVQGQRLIPIDTIGAAALVARPAPIMNGKTGTVRWISSDPVIPTLQAFLILDMSRRDVAPGDQVDLYAPRQKPVEGRDLALPELWIGRAQILRVTPFGASAVVINQEQPTIQKGTAARVAAKMP
jgi:LysM repeat protein